MQTSLVIVFFTHLMINMASSTAVREQVPANLNDVPYTVHYSEHHGHRIFIQMQNPDYLVNGNFDKVADSYAAIAFHKANGFAFSAVYPDEYASSNGEVSFMHKGANLAVADGDFFFLTEDYFLFQRTRMIELKQGKCSDGGEPFYMEDNGVKYYPVMLYFSNTGDKRKILGTFVGDVANGTGNLFSVNEPFVQVSSASTSTAISSRRLDVLCKLRHINTWKQAQ